MPVQASISSQQTMQVGVSGPGDVATLHVVAGIANAGLNAFAPSGGGSQSQRATFATLVGPQITAAQFRRAIATAAISSLNLQGQGNFEQWSLTDVDADFDEDNGRVELTFDLQVFVAATSTASVVAAVASVGFQVLILTT